MTEYGGAGGWRSGAVALVLLFALAPLAPAAAPPVALPAVPGPGPLFDPEEIHTNPVHMAVAVLAAGGSGRTGSWGAAATLFAGEHPRVSAWRLEGPLTNLYSRRAVGASALTLAGFQARSGTAPLSALATLRVGAHLDCWTLLDTDRFRPLPQAWLNVIRDSEGILLGGPEADVYSRVLIRAHYTSVAAFRRAARHDLTYAHVFNDAETYRGAVVPILGQLKRINRFPVPPEAAEAGVTALYEGWVFIDQLSANPYCVLFTEWPADLPRHLLGKERIDEPVQVRFAGYFFKKFRYTAKDPRATRRDAPLLMGHTLEVVGMGRPAGSSSTALASTLLLSFAGILSALILGVIGLTLWFRRNDNRIRQRLLATRHPEFVLPPPDEPPPIAPPVAAPVRSRVQGTEQRLVTPPRITFPAASGDRAGESTAGDASKHGTPDPPPEEGAGA